jgi:hypothetical protein
MKIDRFRAIYPRFKFGESNESFMDCAGLVILYLRSIGYTCEWENDLDRKITNINSFEEQMISCGFKLVEPDKIDLDRVYFVTWSTDLKGHIGLWERGLVCSMWLRGINYQRNIINYKLWLYNGN